LHKVSEITVTKKYILAALLSGALLSLPWMPWHLGLLLWVAFIPLLWIEHHVSVVQSKGTFRTVLTYAYISFFTWNVISTWWVSNSTLFGGIAAVVLNALFYTILFALFHLIKKQMGTHTGYSALVLIWLAFEHIYLNGAISWTWLILGNGFANNVQSVQWYEFTGVLGGSLWSLIINILLFNIGLHVYQFKTLYGQRLLGLLTIMFIIGPLFWSMYRYHSYREANHPINISIIQPNIDPYNEKFGQLDSEAQLKRMTDLMRSHADQNADLYLWPETALEDRIFENNFKSSSIIVQVDSLMKAYPKALLVSGATTRSIHPLGKKTDTSKPLPFDTTLHYDTYNAALGFTQLFDIEVYHKSKLVIGVEMTPYPAFFEILNEYLIDLGGYSGNLGWQTQRTNFTLPTQKAQIAPIICYESIYGDFVTGYVKNGAQLLAIITNDGWWGDTQGYQQHLSYAKLRAIENRRAVARCANTGVSALINQKGDIISQTPYWESAVLNGTLNLNTETTFYTRTGDYIGRIAEFFALLLCLALFASWVKGLRKPKTLQHTKN